jgi:hypothetical protein
MHINERRRKALSSDVLDKQPKPTKKQRRRKALAG